MNIYTIRDSLTGQTYDIPLDRDIGTYRPEEIRAIIAQQDQAREAEVRTSRDLAAGYAAIPRGPERQEAMEYQPLEIPGVAETTAREMAGALSSLVPNLVQSGVMVNRALGPTAAGRYAAETLARGRVENPLSAAGRYAAEAVEDPVYQLAKSLTGYYDYDRSVVPEEQQAISQVVGGGVGSAMTSLPAILAGPVGIAAVLGGQGIGPSTEQFLERGADPGRAFAQGMIEGGIEAGSEYVLGLPGKIARRLGLAPQMSAALKPIADRVDQAFRSWVGELGLNMTQEGLEEMIAGTASDLSAAYLTGADPNALEGMLERRLMEFAGGAVGGAVFTPVSRSARQEQERRQRLGALRDQILRDSQEIARLRQQWMAMQPQPPTIPGVVEQEAAAVSEPITGVAEAIARANAPTDIAQGQDLPYDLLNQFRQPTPPNQAQGGPPYNLLDQFRQQPSGAPQGPGVPVGLLSQFQEQPAPVIPIASVGQDLPYDLLTQIQQQTGQPVPPTPQAQPKRAKSKTARALARRKDVFPADDLDAIAAEAERQELARGSRPVATTAETPAAPVVQPEPEPATPEAVVAQAPLTLEQMLERVGQVTQAAPTESEGGEKRGQEVQREGQGEEAVAPGVLPAVPPTVTPPPSQESLRRSAELAAAPPMVFGLDQAKDTGQYVREFRKVAQKIANLEDPELKEKALADLMEEHRRNVRRPEIRSKEHALRDLEVWAALKVASPSAAWTFLEMSIGHDLKIRQRKWTEENLDRIGDVPPPNATPEEVAQYEARARAPWWEMAVIRAEDGAPSPWDRPLLWLNRLVGSSNRPGESAQMTNVHAFIQIGDKIHLMPVYDSGQNIPPDQRIHIGDPELMGKTVKWRPSATAWSKKYGKNAKFLGALRLPLSAAQDRLMKTEWTPEEYQGLITDLSQQQDQVVQAELYPGRDLETPASTEAELEGEVDGSFIDELVAREPAMAHIRDFVSEFAKDDPPIFGTDAEIKRWAIRRFEQFVHEHEDAWKILKRVAGVMMQSAIVRDVGSVPQGVAGLPLGSAASYEKLKVWFKEQVAQAVLEEVRSAPGQEFAAKLQELLQIQQLDPDQAGVRQGGVSPRASQGVAERLAGRVAPGIRFSSQQLRERGLRTSEPGDFETVQDLTRKRRTKKGVAQRARELAKLRERGQIPPLSTPPVSDPGRVRADIEAIRQQARPFPSPTRPSVPPAPTAVPPKTAPPLRWRQFVDAGGYSYWIAPATREFVEWRENAGLGPNVITIESVPGVGSIFRTYIDPARFTVDQPVQPKKRAKKAQPVEVKGRGMMVPRKPVPPATPEETLINEYLQAVEARRRIDQGTQPSGAASTPKTAEKLIRFGIEGLRNPGRRMFLEDQRSGTDWALLLDRLIERHPDIPERQAEAMRYLRQLMDGNSRNLYSLANVMEMLGSYLGEKKKTVLRLAAARFSADPDDAQAFAREFGQAFRKVGGDALRVDRQSETPIAVEISDDGQITLAFNPEKLSKLSWEEWSVVWDEELRHVALFSFVRQRLVDRQFSGLIGQQVRQELSDAWESIDGLTRSRIEDAIGQIYGQGLDPAQKTAELVRMIGQGNYLTEGITRRSLGQRFIQFLTDFADWLKRVFGRSAPKPIRDLVDGVEALLQRVDGQDLDRPVLVEDSSSERNEAALRAEAASPNATLDRQRINPSEMEYLRQSGIMRALGRRRLDEVETLHASLVDQTVRDGIADLETRASTPIPSGLSWQDRRRFVDDRRAAAIALGRLKGLSDLAKKTPKLQAPSLGMQVMTGQNPNLDDDQKVEVLHDAVTVLAQHERFESDQAWTERAMLRALYEEGKALKNMMDFLGSASSPEVMREWIKNRLLSIRSDISQMFDLSKVVDPKLAAHASSINLMAAADQTALSAALSVLGQKGAVKDVQFLIDRLANDPRLDLSNPAIPFDPDQFYDYIVQTSILGDAIAGGPGLSQSAAIAALVSPPSPNVGPPLKLWGQLRSVIEQLQGYREEYQQAVQELNRLKSVLDPLSTVRPNDLPSMRRVLYKFQSEVRRQTVAMEKLGALDRKLRSFYIARRAMEIAGDQLHSLLTSSSYRTQVDNAVKIVRRKSDEVIFDTKTPDGVRPGTLTVVMPPDQDGNRKMLTVELTFDQASTDANRQELAKAVADIESWLSSNPNADPVLRQTYYHAARYLENFLSPDFAISEGTIDESGIWGLLGEPMKLPFIRSIMHPVLKEIEDSTKGIARGVLSRAMLPFVRWGLFEQGVRAKMVKIKARKFEGMRSHGMDPEFRALSRDVFNPWRVDQQDDAYRWVVIEPIIRSWQSSFQHHAQAGDWLEDPAGLISPTGKVMVTKQDIEAARAQAEYERDVRQFVSQEGMGFDSAQTNELVVVEDSLSGERRSRIPFAGGPGVMSRSLSHKANGEVMDRFRQARVQVPPPASKDPSHALNEAGMLQLIHAYLPTLRGTNNGGATDIHTWTDVVMSHVLETNPEYVIRRKSKLLKVYDSLAVDLRKSDSFRISGWSDLIQQVATRMETLLGDTRPMAERLADAEMTIARELTTGMENLRTIIDNQERSGLSDVSIGMPKSSFNSARGSIVGPPGLYEHGLHSDFAINALHGTVLRHVTNNLLNAMKVVRAALDHFIESNRNPQQAATISERKRRAEAAYRVGEAIRLSKAITDHIQLMETFEQATRDPEQYYHDIMRWSSILLVRPLVSPITNTWSVLKDLGLTNTVTTVRQRRSLWGMVNWFFTSAKSVRLWLENATTIALASFGQTPSSRRMIKSRLVSLIPGMAAAVHSAGQRVAQLRADGVIRGISAADEMLLMRSSGSLLGIQGALEYEQTRPLGSKIMRYVDRFIGGIPIVGDVARAAVFAVGESRTIFEDINAMMIRSWAEADVQELVRRSMEALEARDRSGNLVVDPTDPGFVLTDEELRLSFGGARQARRWFGQEFDQAMLRHYMANQGKTVEEIMDSPMTPSVLQTWFQNYLTDSQVQTLRERPSVSFTKGLSGRVSRSFGTFKVWSSSFLYSTIRGEILKNRVTRLPVFRVADELAGILAMILMFLILGSPTILGVEWLRDKLGGPRGLTVENLIRNPDMQTGMLLLASVAAQVIPNGSVFDEMMTGIGSGQFNIFRLSPHFGGAMDLARTVAQVIRTSVPTDPASWGDALSFAARDLAIRRLPVLANMVGMSDEGYRQSREATRSAIQLGPRDAVRSPQLMGGRIPSSPAYDNVRRATELMTEAMALQAEGKMDQAEERAGQAEAEAQEGLRQMVKGGEDPEGARKKLQSMFGAFGIFRQGFERSLTDEEKREMMERATPDQRRSMANKEMAVRQLSQLFGSRRSAAIAVGSGAAVTIPKAKPPTRRLVRQIGGSPSAKYFSPILRRGRARRSGSRLARLARLRRRLRQA